MLQVLTKLKLGQALHISKFLILGRYLTVLLCIQLTHYFKQTGKERN